MGCVCWAYDGGEEEEVEADAGGRKWGLEEFVVFEAI